MRRRRLLRVQPVVECQCLTSAAVRLHVDGKFLAHHFGPSHKLLQERLGALLQGVKDERERTGAVSQVEQLLEQQPVVSPLMDFC